MYFREAVGEMKKAKYNLDGLENIPSFIEHIEKKERKYPILIKIVLILAGELILAKVIFLLTEDILRDLVKII